MTQDETETNASKHYGARPVWRAIKNHLWRNSNGYRV